MSLIERAIDKLGQPPSRDAPLPERAVAATVQPEFTRTPIATPAAPAASAPAPAVAAERAAPSVRLDWAALARRGFVSQDNSGSVISDEFRVIKRPLLGNAFARDKSVTPYARRVMVTSAYPDEGKSFCAVNLALSIVAERDHRVLLVDADVARPSLPSVLGYERGPGLIDMILEPDGDSERYVRSTSIDKLSILDSGRSHDLATELLASQATQHVLDALMQRYPDRVIIFDSPPLLLSTESRELAPHMGQVVLVVAAGSTPRAAVTEALSAVEACPIVGLVFNKSRDVSSRRGYGYGYGYRPAKA